MIDLAYRALFCSDTPTHNDRRQAKNQGNETQFSTDLTFTYKIHDCSHFDTTIPFTLRRLCA